MVLLYLRQTIDPPRKLARIRLEGSMARRILGGILVLLVLGMDWAALHDILKGEADVWLEWVFLIASLPLLIIYFYKLWRRGQPRQTPNDLQ